MSLEAGSTQEQTIISVGSAQSRELYRIAKEQYLSTNGIDV